MRISITIIFLILGCTFSIGQTDFQKKIIGKWQFVKETNDSKVTPKKELGSIMNKETEDPFMKKDIVLTFQNKTSIAFEIGEFLMVASYTLQDSLVTIGTYQYKILNITKDKLYFKAKNSSSNTNYEYRRVVSDE